MGSSGKVGQSILQFVFTRMVLLSIPGILVMKLGPEVLKRNAVLFASPISMEFSQIIIALVAVLSLIAIIRPKVLIKPLFGVGVYYLTLREISLLYVPFGYTQVITGLILFCAGLASCYLCLYDTAILLRRIGLFLRRNFSKKSILHWDGNFSSTKEKGDALEEYVRELYQNLYGNAKTTNQMKEEGLIPNGPGDQGADVIVNLPNNRRLAIQCKNVSSPMGNSAVQEIMTAKAYYQADELAIISPNGFTGRCIELARAQGRYYNTKIELIDAHRLEELATTAGLSAA